MFSAQDRWLTKNVKAEEESEKESNSSEQSPSSIPPSPPPPASYWSRKDDKEMDEMLGMGDHAAPITNQVSSSPVHRVTNDNLMSIAGGNRDYFDDEEDVSTLANDTVANEHFFKNNRMSPPRQVRSTSPSNNLFPEFATPNTAKRNKFADSPTNTAPETPPKDDKAFKDFEDGKRFSKKFWRVVILAACLGSFLVAAVIVLGMNYYNIREERVASAEGAQPTRGNTNLQTSSEGTSDNGEEFQFDFSTLSPSTSDTASPTVSPAPTMTKAPSHSPSLTPSIATASPTTMHPSASPTQTASMGPTLTYSPTGEDPTTQPSATPTGMPTTLSPTMGPSATPTGLPTTIAPTMVPTTPVPTQNVPEELIELLMNAPHFPVDSMIAIEFKDEETYPYQVVQWLARDPNLSTYSEEVIIQRYALASLYMGVTKDLDSNPMETTWMTYTDFCEWTVSSETLCDEQGLASSIYLENFGLEGEIVPEIALLADSLTKLVVTNNGLYGSFPTEIGFLTNLNRLRTHNNAMVGTIPTQIGNMRSLLSLRLGRNEHTGTLPTELAQLPLETIHMPRNQFSGPLFQDLTTIDSLITLNLKDNFLTGDIPENLIKMPNLVSLELQHNDFTGEVKKKEFCKNLETFIVDCAEVNCKCCKEENCCVNCEGRGF